MNNSCKKAKNILQDWKGDNYICGIGCFDSLGKLVASCGKRVAVVTSGYGKAWAAELHTRTQKTLTDARVQIAGDLIAGARPNAPREDVLRIAEDIKNAEADVVLVVGGGSVIDAVKAAVALNALGEKHPNIEEYFGVGKVSEMLSSEGLCMKPIVAAALAASSSAHLTKYSNITDIHAHQKKLIVDEAVVPQKALFDYSYTTSMSRDFTSDGALDGIAHSLEVFYGAKGDILEQVDPIARLGIELIIHNVRNACDNPDNLDAREALGLGTDLGGYSIMIGGTNGAHLTSFSLVDILSHGRACALMNPYYTVFFAPAITYQLRAVGNILKSAGYTNANIDALSGKDLGIAVAEGFFALSEAIGFPTCLNEVHGFSDTHIERALAAAKNPQLEMKLKNMPIPLTANLVDEYMRPILEAAKTGNLSRIKMFAG